MSRNFARLFAFFVWVSGFGCLTAVRAENFRPSLLIDGKRLFIDPQNPFAKSLVFDQRFDFRKRSIASLTEATPLDAAAPVVTSDVPATESAPPPAAISNSPLLSDEIPLPLKISPRGTLAAKPADAGAAQAASQFAEAASTAANANASAATETRPRRLSGASLRAQALASYTRLDSTDVSSGAEAQILSDLNAGLRLAWDQRWASQLQTHLDFELQRQKWLSIPTREIENREEYYSGISLGGEWVPTPRFTLGANFGVKQSISALASTSSTLFFQKILLSRYSVTSSFALIKGETRELRLRAEYGLSSPMTLDDLSIRSGNFYKGELVFAQSWATWKLLVSLNYGTWNYDSNYASHSLTELGIGFGFQYHLPE